MNLERLQEIEKELKHLEETIVTRRDLALSFSNVGIWDWDIEKGTLWWDEKMLNLYGIQKDDFFGSYDDWINRLHPDDRENAQKQIDACLFHDVPYIFRFRVVKPNNKEVVISGFGNCIKNEDNKPIRMVGINVLEGELCREHYVNMKNNTPCKSCPSNNCSSFTLRWAKKQV
jgi:PAS domain-containing protein